MTARKSKAKPPVDKATRPPKTPIIIEEGEETADAITRATIAPALRHGQLALELAKPFFSGMPKDQQPALAHFVSEIATRASEAGGGDMALASRLLAAQAMTLDGIFTECARRSALNMGEYINASERYMRLALKAQANSRATIEALAKLHSPREQTVRHVHVNEGGQAVIADEFHHHAGGAENAQSTEQPHATRTGAIGGRPALSGPDPLGEALSLPGGEGAQAVPNARRQG
ncbi:MAG TPA: hypothetical protein VNZ43_09375 [Sphingomonadaceae bacterium]|nr:hypothetical protein [Sphingomonadaceae bacterium]